MTSYLSDVHASRKFLTVNKKREKKKTDERYFYLRSNRLLWRNIAISMKGNHNVVIKEYLLKKLFDEKYNNKNVNSEV